MNQEQSEITKRILNFTLEIIYLLTGEDYTLVKNLSGICVTPSSQESGGWSRRRSPITDPPPHSRIHERSKEKILEVTNKMIELLTGEVPIRCQDVTVYFSMEEWEYLEGHKDLYEDVMMEDDSCPSSQDGSRRSNLPERWIRPLYSQDRPEENRNVPENQQGEDLMDIKVEVIEEEETEANQPYERNPPERSPRPLYPQDRPEEDHNVVENHQIDGTELCTTSIRGRADIFGHAIIDVIDFWWLLNVTYRCWYLCKEAEDLTVIKVEIEEGEMMRSDPPSMIEVEEEILVDVTAENPIKNSEKMLSLTCKVEDDLENLIPLNVHPELDSTDPSYNPSDYEESSPELSQITSTDQRESEMFQCGVCGKEFTKSLGLFTHRRIHTGKKFYSCSECGKSFTQKSKLDQCERSHTGEKLYSCLECGKSFIYKSHLDRHESSHIGEKPYSCSECGKSFTKKSNLVKHQKIHTGEKPFSCSECGKRFIDKTHLVAHERSHTGEKPYSCSECGKCFTKKSNLLNHQRMHAGEKPYTCLLCGKFFTDKSSLVTHERIHTGQKLFSCLECGKCFTGKSSLVIHERIHSGEKPFSCSVCGKGFTNKSDLGKHGRIHTGEKPYSCSHCGKCFTNKSSLITHERIHTGEKPYPCSQCGKCFTTKSSQAKHERSHTEEKPL